MDDLREAERMLKALANRRRLSIIKYLKTADGASVGAIAARIKLSFKSTSRHLLILSSAEILQKEQIGLTMIYSLSKDLKAGVRQIVAIL